MGNHLHFEIQRPAEPHPNIGLHAAKYASKIAAETINVGVPVDLSDAGILAVTDACVRPLHPSEIKVVREAFVAIYGGRSHD